jgi:hypothetical protein
MKDITCNADTIAFCGLYCGACKKFLSDKCPGCQGNDKASWCKIRACCMEHDYRSCADCTEFADVSECKKFDNFMARIFGLLFNSNRVACIHVIKDQGYDAFAEQMTESKRQSMPR